WNVRFTVGPASTCSCVFVPNAVVGADESTDTSARTVATGVLTAHGTGTPMQAPSTHASSLVQLLASSHGPAAGPWTQPCERSHASTVHTLPSSQSRARPGTHCPPAHTSSRVQAFPSSQARWFGRCSQPWSRSQRSVVHTLASSQSSGTPMQTPERQASLSVHTLPSSHGTPSGSGVSTQPTAGSQASAVHGLSSSH